MLAYVGLCWPMLSHLGAMLGPCLGHLCWNDLKMPICPPCAPSWSPKPRENRGFLTSPRWIIPCRRRARNTVKNDVFWRGLQSTGSASEVGRRQGRERTSGRWPLSPCPCRRPSLVTEGYTVGAATPTSDAPPSHSRSAEAYVIYVCFLLAVSKKNVFYGVSGPSAARDYPSWRC